ncbi:hypothetical protein FPANT_1755 [Fusarium pseudoanthophilum]|uniref:Heterokaryon incompatibility domain-containing protein n=1 Tax=Fusarium pseudoanthophilum TaxID=48495 RepID=A0A8H5UY13_9HYPO|nr:hypothetical protein FPANT_1755 [Fusarium pseudoanthophilum]
MSNLLRQDILAKAPIPQDESPLYAKLPGEVRDSIFSYVLTDHPDPTPDKKFKENTCYTRPSYLAAQSTDTRLLRTCRAIYRETWFKPFLLREHTEWATGEDRAPPPHKAPPRLRPMLAKISKSLGTDKVEIERLRVFAQMYRLQENGLQEVLRTPHLAPRTITLTIRHTDWWYWEEDEPLHFDGNWIEGVCQVLTPSTTQFCIELESLERKKDQVDKIAKQMVDSWFFKRPDGVVLYADTSDANRKVSRWSGSSTWHGQRWIRDETEPHKLDYYIVSITFRPLISIERSGGSASEKAIKEAQDPQVPERPKLSLPDNEKRIETENPCEWVSDSDEDDGYNGIPQPESDNDEWYAEMEEIYGNGRFMQGLFDDASAYPPYAILSHCWYSSEQELTFKDFEDLSQHTSKPGYSKIVSACHAAVTQGYNWLWADSVCINAEDNLEKEETVNSLYSMFLKAGVCLLYLSEIPNANIKDDDKEILSSAVRKSRWASRAWTYKELIPPHKSVFYAADWSQLDPEFQAEISTNILGVNQDNGSREDRKRFHPPLEGPSRPTGAGPLSSFENFSSDPTVDEAERSMIAHAGRNLNITQNGALDKLTWSYSYTVKYRRGLRDNYGDGSKGDPIDPQANSQSVIKILILDNDHAVRNTLATLLRRLNPAQVIVDSGDVVNFEKSGYDIVFARGKGTRLLHMPPNYCLRETIPSFTIKRPVFAPNPSSSVQKISFQEHGTHQVICECQKQKFIEWLVSFVPGVEQSNENVFILKFNVSRMSSSDLASCSSEQESIGQDQLLGHPTIGSVTSDLLCDRQAIAHVPDDGRCRFYLIPMKDIGPADSCHHNPALVNTQSPHEHGSVQSDAISNSLYSSTIEFTNQSHGTPPSTVPTSMPHQPQNPKAILGPLQTTECQAEGEEGISSSHHKERQNQWPPRKSEKNCAEFDAATTYSFDTLSDDPNLQYFQAFIDQLAEDVSSDSQCTTIKNVGPEFLEETLREFAWKLHGESKNPFQLETSVIIHRKRRHIVDLLEFQIPAFETAESESGHSSMSSGKADHEDEPPTKPFRKPEEEIVDWISDIGSGEPNGLSQMPQYRQFIQGSEAYQWLLTNISQQSRLSCEEPSLMNRIGATIRSILKKHIPQHKMSRKQACIDFEMTYSLTLDIIGMMKRSGISSSFDKALTNILCLTGKCDEAQATSVAEYMAQTWPQSSGAIISLLQVLLSDQESFFSRVSPKTVQFGTWTAPNWPGTTRENYSNHCFLKASIHKGRNRGVRYEITARGGYYAVSEVGEQIAWLASVFQEQKHTGFVSIMPRVTDFSATALNDNSGSTTSVTGKCYFSFSEIPETAYNPKQGFCWEQLFSSLNIVRGYPILRRSVPNPGLEVSLRYAASIVGSSEVVQWGGRLVIKGFNMLMVATQATADFVIWHLLVSQKPEERISYVDTRLDHIDIKSSEEISFRHIEGKRHIIGWCTKATDLCGHPTANHEIKPGGLPKSSPSIVVDKLYIEGGSPVTAGLMLDVNKKDKPFWLQREKDYPSLLNWVKLQPVIFYDVEERRAWLVDGASALLHLVRISLHLDINDPESAYDWVYDPNKLKDHWSGVGSRQAALHTLKSWENRALNVYIVDKHMDTNGVPVTKYSTFQERVERILYSIEKLIDRQAQAASQDGIRISQTLDPRREVVGFDIVDVIDPAVPIYPRIQHLNSWGHGWIDLIPTVGITALFGRGLGDLIRADEPDLICPNWRSVPAGKDYLAASISTMQMLHEKRLLRMEPGLMGGELTKKITWVAPKEASLHCKCHKRQGNNDVQTAGAECNHNPVQFLAKRWWSRTIPHGLKPVQLGSLDSGGAVIFGHTVLGLMTGDRSATKQADDDGAASIGSGEQTQDASASGSIVSQTTSITVPSVSYSSQDAGSAQQSMDGTSNATGEGKKKRWSKFKNWVKR